MTSVSAFTEEEAPSIVATIQDALRRGMWSVAAGLSILGGNRDVNSLTNMIFFARHPELGGRKLRADEDALKREWLDIRDGIVKRAIEAVQSRPAAAPPAPPVGVPSTTAFGTLTAQLPGAPPFSYRFTAEDAVWLARFVRGEAGGENSPENHAVIWSMFNRYALFTNPESHWGKKGRLTAYPTFASFIRTYSTTLQPHLRSCGAVERAQRYDREGRQKWVPLGGTVKDSRGKVCEKGQLQRHLDLQQQPWEHPDLASSRAIAAAALTGRVPNPIGLASDFADTAAYFVDAHPRPSFWPKSEPYPTLQQWRDYTYANAAAHKPPRVWIGDQPNLKQYKKNSFFVDGRLSDLHAKGVRVVSVQP